MAETVDYIQMLQEAVSKASGCDAEHVDSVPVKEVFRGKTIWEGIVEVFDLIKHPKARRAYAWGHAAKDTGMEVRVVTVLELPPVESPRSAVQVSIMADVKAANANNIAPL
jgi:hypothetical protein